VFDVLNDLLQDPDVQGHIKVQNCIKDLSDIEQGYKIDKWMTEVENLLKQQDSIIQKLASNLKQHNSNLNISLGDIQEGQDYLIQGQDDLRIDVENNKHDLTLVRSGMTRLFQRSNSFNFTSWYAWTEKRLRMSKKKIAVVILVTISLLMTLALKDERHDQGIFGHIYVHYVLFSWPFPRGILFRKCWSVCMPV
jgi:hypothetical protein